MIHDDDDVVLLVLGRPILVIHLSLRLRLELTRD